MEKSNKKTLGEKGLIAASRYLEANGYEILEQNYRCKYGLCDIIAKDEVGIVCFFDVKTSSGIACGLPEECVNSSKQAKYEKIAMHYMADKENIDNLRIRFDQIAICASENNHALLRHHKDCFDGRDGALPAEDYTKKVIEQQQKEIDDLKEQLNQLLAVA